MITVVLHGQILSPCPVEIHTVPARTSVKIGDLIFTEGDDLQLWDGDRCLWSGLGPTRPVSRPEMSA